MDARLTASLRKIVITKTIMNYLSQLNHSTTKALKVIKKGQLNELLGL
jgi:hypothetical protein